MAYKEESMEYNRELAWNQFLATLSPAIQKNINEAIARNIRSVTREAFDNAYENAWYMGRSLCD